MPYQKTQDTDSQQSAGGQKQIVYFNSITAMPAYVSKSVEELRAEDYAVCFSNRREGSFCVLLFLVLVFSPTSFLVVQKTTWHAALARTPTCDTKGHCVGIN